MGSVRPWGTVSRRLAACALAALACATVPSSSSADVGPGDWGIADDMYVPRITLDETFDELEPKSFRLIAAWDRLHDAAYRSEIQSKIAEANAAARTPGGMEIAVSFSQPPQTWQGVPLTGQAWLDQVAPFIARFTPDVEWWSPVNEPGLKGWTFTPSGAAKVAEFSVLLRDHLQQLHPDDRQLSPDFNDHYNSDGTGTLRRHPDGTSFVERYVKLFDAAGGYFGTMASWHVHGGVRNTSALSTDDFIATLAATSGAGLPIWITEAGSPVNDTRAPGQTEAQQAAQVQFLADTNTGIASRDQVTRISYYHMRQEPDPFAATCTAKAGFPWDTGLVRVCGEKRPAWYVWCLASRQADGACYDDSPGVASWGSTRIDVFWRGNGDDAATYTRYWDGTVRTTWSSVSSHGGSTSSSPAAVGAGVEAARDLPARRQQRRVQPPLQRELVVRVELDRRNHLREPGRVRPARHVDRRRVHPRHGQHDSAPLAQREHVVVRLDLDRRASRRRHVRAGHGLERDRQDRGLRPRRRRRDLATDPHVVVGRVDEHRWRHHVGARGHEPRHEPGRPVRPRHGRPAPASLDRREHLVGMGHSRRVHPLGARGRGAELQPHRPLVARDDGRAAAPGVAVV